MQGEVIAFIGILMICVTVGATPAVRFQGAINGAASFVFEKDAAVTGWDVEGRVSACAPWRKMSVEIGTYPWNVGWVGCPLLRVPLKAPCDLRVRAIRKGGADDWVLFGRMDPGGRAVFCSIGNLVSESYGLDNLGDGRLNTLFETTGRGGWCGQAFPEPVAIRAVRFVARFGFVTGRQDDRVADAWVEAADDDTFNGARRIAEVKEIRENAVNEIVFDRPVSARAFRLFKPHGAVLDLLELQFVPVADYVPTADVVSPVVVSTKGDDATGDGTRAKPYRTLARAVAAARNRQTMRTVELDPGDYFLSETVRLDARDAGLCIRAPCGGVVRLRGDRPLADWHPDGDGLFAADVPEVRDGRADSRTLFVNGEFAPRAELPGGGRRFKMRNDPSDLKMRTAMEGFWSRKPTDRETRSLEYDPKDLGPGFDAKNAEIRVFHVWSESLCAVASNVVAESRLWFPKTIPPLGIWNRKDYIVYNTREGLTEPGQWYLDRTRGKVVYRPKSGEDMAKLKVTLSLMQTLLRVERAPNVKLEGLTFTGTTPPIMRAGFAGLELPGAVEFAGSCPSTRLDRVTFDRIGGTAFRACNCPDGRVSRCRFTDIGCVGVVFGGPRVEFVSNIVQRFGVCYPSGCGAQVGGKGSHVWRNTVSDGPYSGFLVHSESLYEENRVMRVMRELSDGAAFYAGVHDSVFRNNIVSEVHTIKGGYGGCGFYCDEGSYGNLYENNVTTDVPLPIHMHMGRGQTVRNNVFVTEDDMNLSFQGSRDCSFVGNRVYYSGKYRVSSPDAVSVWKDNVFFGAFGSRLEPKPEVPVQPVKAPRVKNAVPGYRFSLDRDAEGRVYGPATFNGDIWWDTTGLHIRLQVAHIGCDPVTVGKAWGEGDGVRFTINGREFVRLAEKVGTKLRPNYDVTLDVAWPELGLVPKAGLKVPFNAEIRVLASRQTRWFESPARPTALTLVE